MHKARKNDKKQVFRSQNVPFANPDIRYGGTQTQFAWRHIT